MTSNRDSLFYISGRGLYSVFQFATILVFSHLLVPAEYGLYAIVIAMAGFGNAILFVWIKQGVLRFGPGDPGQASSVLESASQYFYPISAVVLAAGSISAAAAGFLGYSVLAVMIGGATVLLVLKGWFELHLEFSRSQERADWYATGLVLRSLFALAVGSISALLFGTFVGPIIGVAFGFVMGGVFLASMATQRVSDSPQQGFDAARLRRYGMPLAAMFLFTYSMSQVDRILVGLLGSADAAGIYAVSYDVAQQAIFVPLMAISLAYFPRAVTAYAEDTDTDAGGVLRRNGEYILMLGVPSVAGLILVTPSLATTLLPLGYGEGARLLMPVVAIAAFIQGFQEFYYNRFFLLREKTKVLSHIHGLGAVFNVVANLIAIPLWGPLGAAATTVATYGITIVVKAVLTRDHASFPASPRLLGSIIAATAVMSLLLIYLPYGGTIMSLSVKVMLGLISYGVTLVILNPRLLWSWLQKV